MQTSSTQSVPAADYETAPYGAMGEDQSIQLLDVRQLDTFSFHSNGVAIVMPSIDAGKALATARLLLRRAGMKAGLFIVADNLRQGFIRTLNDTAKRIDAKYLVYVAEDAWPGRDWLKLAFQMLEDSKKSLLAFNDGKWHGRLASFGMVRLAWIRTLYSGDVFYSGYISHRADDELTELARSLGQLVYEPEATLVELDGKKDFRRSSIEAANFHASDAELFEARMQSGFGGLVSHEVQLALRDELINRLRGRLAAASTSQEALQKAQAALKTEQSRAKEAQAALGLEQARATETRKLLEEERARVKEAHTAFGEERARVKETQSMLGLEQTRIKQMLVALEEERVRLKEAHAAFGEERARVKEAQSALEEERARVKKAQTALSAEQAQTAKLRAAIEEEQARAKETQAKLTEEQARAKETQATSKKANDAMRIEIRRIKSTRSYRIGSEIAHSRSLKKLFTLPWRLLQAYRKTPPPQLEGADQEWLPVDGERKLLPLPGARKGPLLSIVMPVFNVAPYLDTAIVSALNQSYSNFELIIVNDASTDDGRKIIDMHAGQDARIRVVHLEHNTLGGAGIPSNIGIRMARGEYIGFIDSDDWVTGDAFAKMMAKACEFDADVVMGDFCTFTEDDRAVSAAYDGERYQGIPLNKPINVAIAPGLLRLSPVPWRKIYKRSFMQEHGIEYPEGDYFYEDNPLHWFVLSRANRVVVVDDVVSYHRMGREGQTMGASQFKLAAMCSHVNTIWNWVTQRQGSDRKQLVAEFYDYVYRTGWVIDKQTQPAAAAMIKRRFAGLVDRVAITDPPSSVEVRPRFVERFNQYRQAYPDIDITVVIPVFNCADLISTTIESVLKLQRLKFNLLLIDDGSTDDSLAIIRGYEETHPNIHVFQQGNRGAGRARNALIPLITGRYAFFLDADDVIDASTLTTAVQQADRDGNDLLFFKYRIDLPEEGRSRGMFNADVDVWKAIVDTPGNARLQALAAGLINYPWNRIIRTDLLHDENIFFGPTVVHNDIPYHWLSIAAARKIGHADLEVCVHKKFTQRAQITNIVDARRMSVFEALRYTQERISHYPSFEGMRPAWGKFSKDLLVWARERVPSELKGRFDERQEEFLSSLPRGEVAAKAA